MAQNEYAKFARVSVQHAGRGIQANLRLPDSLKFTSNTGNFINFYCAFGDYECGISTAVGRPGWRWFANSVRSSENGAGWFGEFHNGEQVNVKLTVNDRTQHPEFWVNGACRHIFPRSCQTTTTYADCRLIFGALTCPYNGGPLPPWATWHEQVVATNLMFKNVDYQWLPLNQELAVTHVFHWPTQVACPDPKNYQFDTKNLATGIVVATLT